MDPSAFRVGWMCTGKVSLTPCATVEGVLKGYDQMLNLVIDDAREYLRGENRFYSNFTVL